MGIGKILTARAGLVAFAAVLGAFGIANAFVAIFVQARQEVTWSFDVTVSYCADDWCAYSAVLQIANSGRETQDEVVVEIAGLPAGIGASPRILNLSAAAPRDADPHITRGEEDGLYRIRLKRFTPGTLAQFFLRGNVERTPQVETPPQVNVRSEGRVIEGNPRAIEFGRWFG